jgi:hypothetical protein
MKINGKSFAGPYTIDVVIPRGQESMHFKASAVLDYTLFDELCPMPQAPTIRKPNGTVTKDLKNPDFLKKETEWATKRTHYLILKSLEATEGLEWDTVNMGDSDTWGGYQKDLSAAGLTDIEIGRLVGAVIEVNGMDSEKIKQATEDFLAAQREAAQAE